MQTFTSFTQSPESVLDYGVDWTAWLSEGEYIIGVPVVTVDSGLTLYKPGQAFGGVVAFWLSGGTSGQQYNVSCEITTNQGRTDVRSFILKVWPT